MLKKQQEYINDVSHRSLTLHSKHLSSKFNHLEDDQSEKKKPGSFLPSIRKKRLQTEASNKLKDKTKSLRNYTQFQESTQNKDNQNTQEDSQTHKILNKFLFNYFQRKMEGLAYEQRKLSNANEPQQENSSCEDDLELHSHLTINMLNKIKVSQERNLFGYEKSNPFRIVLKIKNKTLLKNKILMKNKLRSELVISQPEDASIRKIKSLRDQINNGSTIDAYFDLSCLNEEAKLKEDSK